MKESSESSRFENTVRVSPELLALIGEGSEASVVREALEQLREAIKLAPVTGRVLEARESRSKVLVIPVIDADQQQRLSQAFGVLKIFPWEEKNGQFVVERAEDLRKLALAGLVPRSFVDMSVDNKRESPLSVRPIDLYGFPLPPDGVSPFKIEPRIGGARPPKTEENDLDAGIDTKLEEIVSRWDQGLVDEDSEEFITTFGLLPNLKLFPQVYLWKGRHCFDKKTGEEITGEEQAHMLATAKEGDPKALEKVIGMHTGFLLYKLALVRKRFPGTDADDLFQEGMMGLLNAVKRFDPNNEKGSPFIAYAGVSIEHRMRNARMNDRIGSIPDDISSFRRSYFKIVEEIQRQHPNLSENDTSFEDILITKLSQQGLLQKVSEEHFPKESDRLDALKRMLRIGIKFVPLDEVRVGGGSEVDMLGESTSSIGVAEDSLNKTLQKEAVLKSIDSLSSLRERIILLAKFGIIPEGGLRTSLFDELCFYGKSVDSRPESMKQILKSVQDFNPENFDPQTFSEKPTMERFVYALSGKVPKEFAEGQESTHAELGVFFGVSRGQIGQLEDKALRKLRHPSRLKNLWP